MQRRKAPQVDSDIVQEPQDGDKFVSEDDTKLTLMEEVFLLGLKDKEGYASFWNGSLSSGLRGCILVELAFLGRLQMEPRGAHQKPLLLRKLHVKDAKPTGDALLDEALKHIKDTLPPKTVRNWIVCLTGETWNLMRLRYHMKKVRERLAKSLVEKGVLTTELMNLVLFDVVVHPLLDTGTKDQLKKKICDALLDRWINDPTRWDKRTLALVMLSNASEVLEDAMDALDYEQYSLAKKRMRVLLDLDFDKAVGDPNTSEVMWAVFASFTEY